MIKNKEYTGGNINGDISLHGYLTSVRDEGDTTQDGMIGVSNADGTEGMFMSINDTHISHSYMNDGIKKDLFTLNRETGARYSEILTLTGEVSGSVFTLTTEDLNDLVGVTKHYQCTYNGNSTLEKNYPVARAGYLECLYTGADYSTIQRYTVYDTGDMYTRKKNQSTGWSAWQRDITARDINVFAYTQWIKNGTTGTDSGWWVCPNAGTASYPQMGTFISADKNMYLRVRKDATSSAPTGYENVFCWLKDTDAWSSHVFVLSTAKFIKGIQSLPVSELNKLEIQDKILELQLKLDKARENNFVESIELIEGQLEILNEKLSEIGVI